jgi:hypothetical protein
MFSDRIVDFDDLAIALDAPVWCVDTTCARFPLEAPALKAAIRLSVR